MALEVYRRKRNFKATPEPHGKPGKRKVGALSFVIQKHAASHLHYDFRLELNGVLLSWAVPKGPSLDPNDKRLAMHVEDHPLEYGAFEGVIPPKQYGAGTVLLWDRGTWVPKEDPIAGYGKGKLKFDLQGEKLRGGWTLVKTRSSKYGGDKAWLLIKEDDDYARPASDARIADDQPASVASGRSMEDIAADPGRVWHSSKSVADNVKSGAVGTKAVHISGAKIKGALKAPLPDIIAPQLATLVDTAPDGPSWVHEMKYDGYRLLCRLDKGKARIYTRNGKDWTEKFQSLAHSVARLPLESAWIDGEVVALEPDGRNSFQALQNALSHQDTSQLKYYAFDLLYVNGYDLRRVTLLERKKLLHALLKDAVGTMRYSEHFQVPGAQFFAQACKLKLEGIISKRADAHYLAGRTRTWLKIKCGMRQEMVIGGYTDPEGARSGLGALLLGVYEAHGRLRYSGKVGTGFDDSALTTLRQKLDRIAVAAPPFYNPPTGAEARRSHWVKPVLVAEIAFTEWTDDGTLRHASFQGLRADKKAIDVVREQPAGAPAVAALPVARVRGKKTARSAEQSGEDTVAGIKISNPGKLLYPEAGLSKLDLVHYYTAVSSWILPHLQRRPLTLVRCPNGWDKSCFYQKNADAGVNAAIERVTVHTSTGPAQYMMANTLPALVVLVQMGALELHPWGSTQPKLGFPDCMIFDFDPGDDLAWKDIAEAARLMKTLFEEIGLRAFLKTTGGKGLHVVIPIKPTLRWATVKGFTKAVADLMAATFPERFTPKISKASRAGKIFVDYLRNDEGSTAIAPYSIRARAQAPVATPIAWEELAKDVRNDYFNVRNVPTRLKRLKKHPWQDYFDLEQTLTSAMMKRAGYSDPGEQSKGSAKHRRKR